MRLVLLRACMAKAVIIGTDAWSSSMMNYFESAFWGIALDRQVTNPNIIVGRYSYYSGYYHGHSFDDCARFLLPVEGRTA